jgi:hypothetical protein
MIALRDDVTSTRRAEVARYVDVTWEQSEHTTRYLIAMSFTTPCRPRSVYCSCPVAADHTLTSLHQRHNTTV